MSHPFHTGRYSGAATIPRTDSHPVPAAALVVEHTQAVEIAPMFRQLDRPGRGVAGAHLVPITVVDFYARARVLPDLHPLGREEHSAGHTPRALGDLRAWPAVAVPASRGELSEVHSGSAGNRSEAAAVEGAH